MNMHFNPIPILKGIFLRGDAGRPPSLYIDSDPPTFYMVKYLSSLSNLSRGLHFLASASELQKFYPKAFDFCKILKSVILL